MGSLTPSNPELLYVNSKLTSSKLSPTTFTKWYSDVHIPDIFATSGIKTAYRYETAAANSSTIERPYLALYPIKFEGYLQSPEFRAIPVKTDVLPNGGEIFEVADFDTRYYKLVTVKKPFGGM